MAEPKIVSFRLNVWANRRQRMIHLTWKGAGGHTTVSNDPENKRYHPGLFKKLRRVLVDAGKWPEGL